MNIQWPWLLIAVALLIPPPVLSAELKRNLISARRNESIKVKAILVPWQNWADLFRAGAGVWLLANFGITANPALNSDSTSVLARLGVLSAATILQTIRLNLSAPREEHRIQIVAPVFYLCGASAMLGGVVTGGFGLLAGWLFAFGTARPLFQLPSMGVGMLGAGYLFGINLSIISGVVLIVIPFALAFAFHKRLVFVGTVVRLSSPPARKENQPTT